MLKAERNWKVHRRLVRHATPPCIPYLGMYLTDLVYTEDSSSMHGRQTRVLACASPPAHLPCAHRRNEPH